MAVLARHLHLFLQSVGALISGLMSGNLAYQNSRELNRKAIMTRSSDNQTRHWVHGIAAGVPVILLVLSFVLDLINLPTTNREPSIPMAELTCGLVVAGLIGMIIVSIPGLADYSYLRAAEPMRSIARQHLVFNGVSFLAFAGSLASRWAWPVEVGPPLVPIALSTFGVGFLGYASYLGYRMMYPRITSPQDDLISYDASVESREARPVVTRPATATPPGIEAEAQWKKAELDEQRWRLEPRVDADGDTI